MKTPSNPRFSPVPPARAQGFENVFRHETLGIQCCLVPAGEYRMGLSEDEYRSVLALNRRPTLTVAELRPTHPEKVAAFYVSRFPVTRRLLGLQPDPDFPTAETAAMRAKPEVDAFLSRNDARLPTEAEWEYLCRAGTRTLFPFGDTLPDDDELARWCSWDYSDPDKQVYNAFGLGGLFIGEWCSDLWRNSHSALAKPQKGIHVIRGGGAQFWPWQDHEQEFVWCLSTIRMPSSHLFGDKAAAFRMVFDA